MKKIDALLAEYDESHQTKFNKMVHYFCVPAIFFSLIGLLSLIPTGGVLEHFALQGLVPYIHSGSVIIILGLFYYMRLSFTLFIGMFLFSALVLAGIYQLERLNFAPLWLIMVSTFIIAWIVQFIGHDHEGKKPSFVKDIQFLMIGPAWTLSHLYKVLGIKY